MNHQASDELRGRVNRIFLEVEQTTRNVIEQTLRAQEAQRERGNSEKWWEGQLNEDDYKDWVKKWEQAGRPDQKPPLKFAIGMQLRDIVRKNDRILSQAFTTGKDGQKDKRRFLYDFYRLNSYRNKNVHEMTLQDSKHFMELASDFFNVVPSSYHSSPTISAEIISYLSNTYQDGASSNKEQSHFNTTVVVSAPFLPPSIETANNKRFFVALGAFLLCAILWVVLRLFVVGISEDMFGSEYQRYIAKSRIDRSLTETIRSYQGLSPVPERNSIFFRATCHTLWWLLAITFLPLVVFGIYAFSDEIRYCWRQAGVIARGRRSGRAVAIHTRRGEKIIPPDEQAQQRSELAETIREFIRELVAESAVDGAKAAFRAMFRRS